MAEVTSERPVYALPLFTWLLLILATPIGLFFLWYHRHYNSFIRILITLVFIPTFQANYIISLGLFLLILFRLLGKSHDELERLFIKRENENQREESDQMKPLNTCEDVLTWDEDRYRAFIRKLFERWGYKEQQPNMLIKGYRFEKHHRVSCVLLFINETITREAIFQASELLVYHDIDHVILVTNESVTLYADELIHQIPHLSVWTMEDISALLQGG